MLGDRVTELLGEVRRAGLDDFIADLHARFGSLRRFLVLIVHRTGDQRRLGDVARGGELGNADRIELERAFTRVGNHGHRS